MCSAALFILVTDEEVKEDEELCSREEHHSLKLLYFVQRHQAKVRRQSEEHCDAEKVAVLWVYENAGESESALTTETEENTEEDSGAKQQPDVTIVDVDALDWKLKFEYMPMGPEEDRFIFDTPINVEVYQVNDDGSKTNITEHVYFQQAECALEMHTEEKETFAMHTGNLAEAAEFMVHVLAGIELPNTGGIGTTVFYVLGGVLLVGALILLVTKKRMNKNEEEDLDVILDDTDDL